MTEDLFERLRHHLVYMCDLAERQVDTAVMALVDGNRGFAKQVFDAEEEMDALDLQVSRIAQDILTQIHPEGENFRFTVAAMRAATCLERVGNIAVDTASQAEHTGGKMVSPDGAGALEELVEAAEAMVRDAVSALVEKDVKSAWETIRRADDVDKNVTRLLGSHGSESRHLDQDAPHAKNEPPIIMAAIDLKRISEHAVAIAEEVVYMVEARLVRHAARLLLKGKSEPKAKI